MCLVKWRRPRLTNSTLLKLDVEKKRKINFSILVKMYTKSNMYPGFCFCFTAVDIYIVPIWLFFPDSSNSLIFELCLSSRELYSTSARSCWHPKVSDRSCHWNFPDWWFYFFFFFKNLFIKVSRSTIWKWLDTVMDFSITFINFILYKTDVRIEAV